MSKIFHHTMTIFICLCLTGISLPILAQSDTTQSSRIKGIVVLDAFVVKAQKQGFNVDDFIQMVMDDKSFYQAFHNLRLLPHRAENKMAFRNKKNKEKAGYKSITQQNVEDLCRSMNMLSEEVSGNFYKRKNEFRYYTAKMYGKVFFTRGKVCEKHRKADEEYLSAKTKGINKHIQELKKLIFNPGDEVNVPVIGNKTAIFSEDMQDYYNYFIKSGRFKNKRDCYIFSVVVKPKYQNRKKNKTIIKYMDTYFEKNTLQVISRNYRLQYGGPPFSFDVEMSVELSKKGNLYFPKLVKYDGSWDIPFKKAEKGKFSLLITAD